MEPAMTVIRTLKIAEALQNVSYYVRQFCRSHGNGMLSGSYAMAQILVNSRSGAAIAAPTADDVVVANFHRITSRTTIELARLASEVGFPSSVINIVLGTGKDVGKAIMRHPAVRKVAFTGSVAVGRAIGHIAADRVIPLILELGGKSANIVFDDAELDFAATETVKRFTLNAGQVCSAGTRVIVQRSVYETFNAKLTKAFEAVVPGDTLGPIITPAQFQRVKGYFKLRKTMVRVALHEVFSNVRGNTPGKWILHQTDPLYRCLKRHTDRSGRNFRPSRCGDPVWHCWKTPFAPQMIVEYGDLIEHMPGARILVALKKRVADRIDAGLPFL